MVKVEDEFRHPARPADGGGLWGDTLWVSVVDRPANIFGIFHFHLTNKGYARYESLFIIDGVQQSYGNKYPLPEKVERGPWSDGRLRYEVVNPLEEIHISFDGPRYGCDLHFRGRFPVFDYEDSVRGNPLNRSNQCGGHFEQGMHCTGSFEIRGGPCKGQTRRLDSWSHRDHTWSTRFAEEPPWEWLQAPVPWHFWPSIQLPDKHINVFGLYQPDPRAAGEIPFGGFCSTAAGSLPMRNATAQILMEDDCRSAAAFRYELTMPDGKVIHVRTGRKYGQVKLWDRGENDLENRLDCYEPFFDFEVEETGEQGYGVAEYSTQPPWPRWLI